MKRIQCKGCGGNETTTFYEVVNAPVHSVLLMRTREQALSFPTGKIELAYCNTCGFISNIAFEGANQNYSAEYEETQGYSGTFNAFHRRLAKDLIHRHALFDKQILEIGCGKGEFLNLLCELGHNRGIGFDPAYIPERDAGAAKRQTTFIRDFYSEKYAHYYGDFVCCKMTLEHIPEVGNFVGIVRSALDGNEETMVFFQIPEVRRILRDVAFWDVYYEHCSYFGEESLAHVFLQQGFEIRHIWTDYDDQYLMIEATPSGKTGQAILEKRGRLEALKKDVDHFSKHITGLLSAWRQALRKMQKEGKRVVLWGGGSKAVAFLTTLGIADEVACAVDINPYKQGTYLAGTGHEVVGPKQLIDIEPDLVIVMNPIYRDEIESMLRDLNLSPEIWLIDKSFNSVVHE